MPNARILLLCIALGLSACTGQDVARDQSVSASRPALVDSQAEQREANKYLAYEHSLRVAVSEGALPTAFARVRDTCTTDTTHGCTLLDSDLNVGQDASASIKLRIKPEGVTELIELLTSVGTISRQATHVEDLAEAIFDTDKRVAMLQNYREKLQQLEGQARGDIEALIRIASELSQVQSDIEQLTGEQAYLKQRVEMDIVTILFVSDARISFWGPIAEAFSSASETLSEGVADTISGVAYLLPWFLVILVTVFGVRRLWRKSAQKAAGSRED